MIKNPFKFRFKTIVLALVGIIFAVIFTNTLGSPPAPKPNQLSLPPSTPYANTVSGTGLVEANSRNINVGTHLSGIISEVYVSEGQSVKKGDMLFKLDDRAALAELDVKDKQVKVAEAMLQTAKVDVADEGDQLKRTDKMQTGLVVSENQQQRRRYASRRAQANVMRAEADIASARAELGAAEVALDKLSVYAPVDGRVLKVRVRPGEFVLAGTTAAAPVLMGSDTPLYLRVAIDENDLWRFDSKSKASAVLRSNKEISFPLKFIRVEPYVQPKQNLTGDMNERVDTRVLEVIYAIEGNSSAIFIGQQLDVFIEAPQG